MAIVKSNVTIYPIDGDEPIANGMIYLHVGQDRGSGKPRVQGTISPLIWQNEELQHTPHDAGERYRVIFEDGRTLTIVLARFIVTACGPEVLRFNAEDANSAAALAGKIA